MNARYRLVESIGQGGMGRVWRAVDEILDRLVAVKEIRIDGQDAEDIRTRRERTLREGRATARIDHPNVVRVYDVVDEGERLWIVMELVPGRSLERIMTEEGPLSPRATARIGLGLAAALRQVHAGGVLHRDIKPGNVLVEDGSTGSGRVVLTDFGIAAIQDAKALTMVGMLVGSPDYMAPERVSGRRQGPPSDLWSLGATLCAALAGHSPFSRDTTLATLHAVLYEEPELPPSAGSLGNLLAALLRKDPATRPALTEVETALRLTAYPPPSPTLPGVPGPPSRPGSVEAGPGTAERAAPERTAPDPPAPGPTEPAPQRPDPGAPGPTDHEAVRPGSAAGEAVDLGPTGVEGADRGAVGAGAVGPESAGAQVVDLGPPGAEAAGPGTAGGEGAGSGAEGAEEVGVGPGTAEGARDGWTAPGPPGPAKESPCSGALGSAGSGAVGVGPGTAEGARDGWTAPGQVGSGSAPAGGGSGPVGGGLVGLPGGSGARRVGVGFGGVPTEPSGGSVGRARAETERRVGMPFEPPEVPAGPRPRRTALLAALGVVAAGIVVAVLLATSGGGGRREGAHGGTATASSSTASSPTAASPTVEGTSRPPGPPPGARTEAGGFAWVPPRGWRRDVQTGAEVHYTSPDGRQELVAKSSLARGDLLDTWRRSEKDARQGRDYVKIRLAETSFQGRPAVVWEYTFTLKGTPWHARLLGFDEDGKSYQINTWYQPGIETQAVKTYSTVKETFTVL
ncbi:protein kinase [Streptomyces sp. NPDC007905]|uniref:serine/threonine-protein kinase n=1 Tax=Streptomyces sp. NPDC007905 TaxID=3364788 RepID=UPI0036E2D6B8